MQAMRTLALLVATSACAVAANLAAAQTKAPSKAPEVLFVQTAKNVAVKDGVLTLQDVAPVTTFVSDRPQRIVGHVRNDLFLKQWADGKNSFKADPPNAALSVFNEKMRPTSAIVVLKTDIQLASRPRSRKMRTQGCNSSRDG